MRNKLEEIAQGRETGSKSRETGRASLFAGQWPDPKSRSRALNILSLIGFVAGLALPLLSGNVLRIRAADLGSRLEILPPLGSYVNLAPIDFVGSTSYTTSDKVVTTSYFYWYDVHSGAHMINSDKTDALTDHPPTLTGFSFKSKAWHKTQLLDMMAAGIDVLLPVYWGAPSERIPDMPPKQQSWSFAGIVPLVEARRELLAEGKQPSRIGMFYDTSTLRFNAWRRHIDLTTDYGRRWFYESVRDFFSLIPPKHWAMIDGRPIVFLYSATFAVNHDQSCIEYLRTEFGRDFAGRTPYIVREISWNVESENLYAWGGALGLKNPGAASLGPGYDHSAVPGREPLVVNREDGQFFIRNWERFLRRPSNLVTIETWNEYHEGTDIAASEEYGRDYIELNRKYVDLFKQGFVPPRPRGPYTDARCLSISLQETNREDGLKQIEWADGVTAPATVAGSASRGVQPTTHGGSYIYFRIDDSFKWSVKMNVSIVVEYFDASPGSVGIEFDGSDMNAPFRGAYSSSSRVVGLTGSKTWKSATFPLTDAVLMNSQNGGADFRLNVNAKQFFVRKVQVVRPGLEASIHSTQEGMQLVLYGEPNRSYTIESSPDLNSWMPLRKIHLETCTAPFTDEIARFMNHRWYRASR